MAAAGCATSSAAGAGAAREQAAPLLLRDVAPPGARGAAAAPARSSHTVIGGDILDRNRDRTLLDVVAVTWPRVLRPEPRTLFAPPDMRGDVVGVYVGGQFVGGQDWLGTVRAAEVRAVYRLSPGEEFARYGHAHDGGALELDLLRRPRGR